MRQGRIRHLVVSDGAHVVGVVSDRDLVGLGRLAGSTRVGDLMASPVVQGYPEMTVRQAANQLRGHSIGCLPVFEDERLVGIVTTTDLLELIGRRARSAADEGPADGPQGARSAAQAVRAGRRGAPLASRASPFLSRPVARSGGAWTGRDAPPSGAIRPLRYAKATAASLVCTSSFDRIRAMWLRTVTGEMKSCSAIVGRRQAAGHAAQDLLFAVGQRRDLAFRRSERSPRFLRRRDRLLELTLERRGVLPGDADHVHQSRERRPRSGNGERGYGHAAGAAVAGRDIELEASGPGHGGARAPGP